MADLKFPLFLDLTGKTAVMVGGGRIALRRTRTLAAFDVRIRVIAPESCEEIRVLSREGKVECIPRAYEPEDLSGAFLVLAATDDPDLNRSIVRQAKERKIRHIYKSCSFLSVLSLFLAYPQQLNIISALESFKYLQSGGTLLTVDIYFY